MPQEHQNAMIQTTKTLYKTHTHTESYDSNPIAQYSNQMTPIIVLSQSISNELNLRKFA